MSQCLLSTIPFSLRESSSELADGVSEMCTLFYQLCKALGSSWFPSFLYYNISVPTYSVVSGQFPDDSSIYEQWHTQSDPVIGTFGLCFCTWRWQAGPCNYKINLLTHLCLHQACACLSSAPQLPSPWDVASWCSFSKEVIDLVCATPEMSYTNWHSSTAHLGQCLWMLHSFNFQRWTEVFRKALMLKFWVDLGKSRHACSH